MTGGSANRRRRQSEGAHHAGESRWPRKQQMNPAGTTRIRFRKVSAFPDSFLTPHRSPQNEGRTEPRSMPERRTNIPRLCGNPKNSLANQFCCDSCPSMIRAGFLDPESREDLIELARDGSAAHRLARRANVVLLLDDGMTCEATARVLFIDDDTIRTWYQDNLEGGIEGLTNFGHEGGCCRLTAEQQDKLKVWIAAALPRTSRDSSSTVTFTNY